MPTDTLADAKHELDAAFALVRAIVVDNINSCAARKIADEALIDLRIAINDYTAQLYCHAARSEIDPAKVAALIDRGDGTWAEVIAASPAIEPNPVTTDERFDVGGES